MSLGVQTIYCILSGLDGFESDKMLTQRAIEAELVGSSSIFGEVAKGKNNKKNLTKWTFGNNYEFKLSE